MSLFLKLGYFQKFYQILFQMVIRIEKQVTDGIILVNYNEKND